MTLCFTFWISKHDNPEDAKMNKTLLLTLLLLLMIPAGLFAWADWKTLSTDKFMVYYKPGCENEAYHALQTLEHYRLYTEKLTGNSYPRLAVKIEDMGNLINGYANPVGEMIALYRYVPTADELSMGEDWFQLVGPHEYIHILQLTKDGGLPRVLRSIFGNLLYVSLHQPMWITEGITVYGESQLSPNAGRMNGGHYSSIISALAHEDRLPSPTKASYYTQDTPLAHYYVFGGSFFSYLSKTYGEDKFSLMFEDNSSRIEAYLNGLMPALALDKAFLNTYGKPLTTLWTEWQESEKAKPWQAPTQRITYDGWEKGNLSEANGQLYYTRRLVEKTGPSSSFSRNSIMQYNPSTNIGREILRQSSEFPAGFHVHGDKLYYSRYELKRGFANSDNDGYGYITEIMMANLDGSAPNKLLSGRIRAFHPMPDGSIIFSEDTPDYRSSIVKKYSLDSRSTQELFKTKYLIHGFFPVENRMFVNARDYWRNSSIYELNLKDYTLLSVVDSEATETLTDIQNGKLIYSAVYDNELGMYQYDLASKSRSKYTGSSDIRTPVTTQNGKTYFLAMNGDGIDLYEDQLDTKAFTPRQTRSLPAPFQYPQTVTDAPVLGNYPVNRGGYANNILHMLSPRILRTPIIEVNGDSLAIGAVLVGSDAVGDFPQWQVSGFYDTHDKKTYVDFSIENSFFSPVHQSLSVSNVDKGSFSAFQYVNLFNRVNYGLNQVNAGFGYQAWDNFQRRLLYPMLSFSMSHNSLQASTSQSLMIENKEILKSDRDRLGWQAQVNLRSQITRASEFRSTINLGYDPDADYDDVFYPLRGYDNELAANKGATLRNTLYFPLWKIRQGSWNPQVYLDDIAMGVFFDAGLPLENTKANAQYSAGLELIAEIGMFYAGQINAGVRVGMNRDQESFVGMILGLGY